MSLVGTFGDERTAPLLCREDSFAIELIVSARHRVGMNAQLRGQCANGGQLIAWFQLTAGDLMFDLLNLLSVDGRALAWIKFVVHKIVQIHL